MTAVPDIGDTPFEKLVSAIKLLHAVAAAFRSEERGPHWEENTRAVYAAAVTCIYEAAMQLENITLEELNEITGYKSEEQQLQ